MKKILLLLVLLIFCSAGWVMGQQRPHVANVNGEVIKRDYQVELYPNPTAEVLNVKSAGDNFVEAEFEIISLIGNKVQTNVEKINDSEYRIPVKQYAAGHYILIIKDKGTLYRRAFKFQKVIR
ncbi:T9SS type A sorting domain-containing protein [Fulvivirgaceae bacterium BMA12]|uniref:T9SS type A sorting domain-containing protein n=1 Tax=Agaribacillus aureus TaxID=3051825 RepID=A0ABT8LCY9_9BACT|nr:T9SS type A sorting domain-containing protein [Fulvivirgaceae bacterium BMA12]